MAFGWSAGDILSAINFIIRVASALDEVDGEVEAIKGPIEKFVNDKSVRALQNNLGVAKEGQFRHLQNIRSKLKWHFSTSEKALALQKVVDMHLKIISTLLQRLTV